MLPIGNSLWNKLSSDHCLVLSQGYPLERKMVVEAEQKVLWVSFTMKEVAQSQPSAIALPLESEKNYPGVSCSAMGHIINSFWEYWRYTLD